MRTFKRDVAQNQLADFEERAVLEEVGGCSRPCVTLSPVVKRQQRDRRTRRCGLVQSAELAGAGVAIRLGVPVHHGRQRIGERRRGRTAAALWCGRFAVVLDPELQAAQRLRIARGNSVGDDW